MFYKLVFVLFSNFRDLGYNAEGITKTLKTASKVAIDRDLKSLTESIDKVNMNNKPKKSKVSYRKKTIRSKMPLIMLAVFLSLSVGINKYSTKFPTEVAVSNILTIDEAICNPETPETFIDDLSITFRGKTVVIEDVKFRKMNDK